MNRLLFVVPHYYRHRPESDLGSESESLRVRSATIGRTLESLHETFGHALSVRPEHRSVVTARNFIEVVVVTTGDDHLMAEIGDAAQLATHVKVDVAPMELGFAAHRILADAKERYDRYGYLEDDILIRDPLLFTKQLWFNATYGADALLQPNRYEASGGLKVYPDGPLPPEGTAGLSQPAGPVRLEADWYGLDMVFERPSNPHSGCFFVDQEQMGRLAAHPLFGVPHVSFVRTLETAASGPVAETFRVSSQHPRQQTFSKSSTKALTTSSCGAFRRPPPSRKQLAWLRMPGPTWPRPIWPLCIDRSRGALPLRSARRPCGSTMAIARLPPINHVRHARRPRVS